MAEPAALEALSVFAEAAQDLVTAGLDQSMGRFYACADACNQATEKMLQSVSLARVGHRAPYNHDLRTLGEAVGAPEIYLQALAALSPFHPESFYSTIDPEAADDAVPPEQAQECMTSARLILRWAREIVVGDAP
ncbi:MAG TPA: HEPN domain-containing protein [Ktedonobacterales bacterium]|nr:HEPN domain-containing protein [Ktedonobacterales bacterium]